jgi:hypothetical protein
MLTQTTITPYQDLEHLVVECSLTLDQAVTQDLLGETLDTSKLIPRGRSGQLVYPGDDQMQILIRAYDRMITPTLFKQIDDLAIRRLNWHSNVALDQEITIRYSFERYEHALGCRNVWWLGEMIDTASGSVLCSYHRCQRWYNV